MRGKSKLTIFMALALVMSLFLSACSGGGNTEGGTTGGSSNGDSNEGTTEGDSSSGAKMAEEQVLNINIKTEPPSLNPGTATDTTSAVVIKSIFEGLTRITPDGVKPAMAKEIKTSDDGLKYTITLRDDIKWSNGDPVTAGDFEYAWKWVLNPKHEATYAYQLYPIKNAEKAKAGEVPLDKVGIKVVNDKKLIVTLGRKAPYFEKLLAFTTFMPVNEEVAKANPKWYTDAGPNFVTNGPYTLEKWEHKDEIVLKKNPKYWDKENVHLNKIQMVMVEDEQTELNMYNNGELDWAGMPTGQLPLAAIPTLKQKGTLNIKPIAGVYYYAFNVEKEPFNNLKIRKAFSYAINRKGIVEQITKAGQIPAMALVPPSMFPENKKGYFQDNNVEKAKELLKQGMKELGYDSVADFPEITLSYNTNEAHAKIAQAIQEMWKDTLGVDVKLYNAEWKVYLKKLEEGNYQVGRMGWLGDFNDAINFLEIFKEKGGNNYTNWHSEKYASLLEKSYGQADNPEQRMATMKQAEKVFMEDMPIAPIYFYTVAYVKKPYVKGVFINGLGKSDYKWAYIAAH
ncbi:MAG TPA: peptide ABC transporter substrate-binding protein [Bacillales bacterium]